MRNFYFLFIAILFFSCQENDDIEINPKNLLIGAWRNASYNNNQTTFERIASLPNNAYAISFFEDSSYIEKSSGWCGTPPLSFFTINGTWDQEESIVSIATETPSFYNWKIISLSETNLVVEYEVSQQQLDHRALMDLYYEIYSIANSITCNNATDWNFTPYGSKACGGPQGYMGYSNQIDVPAFLTLVETYTQAEHDYNIEWGIYSTCDITPQPISVSCENGNAILNY